ncbi:hypothetical protein E4U13_003513 [Claviceps humidiphila]|uniref:Uncharacterized protein n=1 Tax=Claviceps humidiphila TaxID=1294629 RepID=A0A9P7PZG3_9HYPO|nr:hypothetical protein E4U13_003513 [Claviceps humidiphila]
MVKILSIFVTTLAAVGHVAQADAGECISGLDYCGSSLVKMELDDAQSNISLLWSSRRFTETILSLRMPRFWHLLESLLNDRASIF